MGESVAVVKVCPKCGEPMVAWAGDTYYQLMVNPDHKIVGIRKNVVSLIRCKKCGYSEDHSKEEEIPLNIDLPIEFVDALVERILQYIYHKV